MAKVTVHSWEEVAQQFYLLLEKIEVNTRKPSGGGSPLGGWPAQVNASDYRPIGLGDQIKQYQDALANQFGKCDKCGK